MPVWLLKYLPYGVVVIAVLGALWFVDHRGYKRAEDQAKLERTLAHNAQLEANARQAALTQVFEKSLQDMATQSDRRLGDRLSQLDVTNRTIIQPTLVKEIRNDPRQSDPNNGITDGMLNTLNQARSFSWPGGACVANADGSTTCALPPARPVDRQVPR